MMQTNGFLSVQNQQSRKAMNYNGFLSPSRKRYKLQWCTKLHSFFVPESKTIQIAMVFLCPSRKLHKLQWFFLCTSRKRYKLQRFFCPPLENAINCIVFFVSDSKITNYNVFFVPDSKMLLIAMFFCPRPENYTNYIDLFVLDSKMTQIAIVLLSL